MSQTPPTPVTALPPAPSTSSPSTFAALADAFIAALAGFVTQVNAIATNAYNNAVDCYNNAVAAASSASASAGSATNAAASAANAAATTGVVAWVSGTTYAIGNLVFSPANLQTYRRKTNGAGTVDPSADATNWTIITTVPASLQRSARTSNTILGAADLGTLVDITSGTFTQTFTAAATLGAGWYCYVRNSGTGDITVDPNAGELIDGLVSYVMYPGECRLIQCSGTAFTSIVLSPFFRTFTTSGTFTTPPGYTSFGGIAWSGGASGSMSGSTSTQASGGAGGGAIEFNIPASSFGASQTVAVGAGGAQVTAVGNGNTGGNTSVGSLLTVYAGAAYTTGGSVTFGLSSAAPVGFEGASAGAPNAIYGGAAPYNGTAAYACGSSIFGGASGGSVNASAAVCAAGTSKLGGNGGAASSAGNGVDGTAPGGGGGATQTGTHSGAGARGEVRIWGVA